MNRSSNSMMYRTNGTAALKPQAYSFTVHDGPPRAASRFEESLSAYPTTTITVHTGDSLWEIAEDHAPAGMDTATAIRWIEQTNGLDSALIMAGQLLIVPAC